MKSTKKSLLLSTLSLIMCVAMLLGTTYAWFTDSVTSGKNIITAGNLDIEMYYADGTEDPASVTWTDASDATIFNYELWEPGYTDVKHIKIANVGTLALKYQLAIVPDGDLGILADVLDVYVTETATKIAERSDLSSMTKIGTLSQVLANASLDLSGNLMPAGTEDKTSENTLTIAVKMQESAGNEYQNKTIANGFTVVVKATQYTYEEDSFNNQYDKDATYPEIVIPTTRIVKPVEGKTLSEVAAQAAKDSDVGDVISLPKNSEVKITDDYKNKKLTIKGEGASTVIADTVYELNGISFENLTLDASKFSVQEQHKGFKRPGDITYTNCTIKGDGKYALYGDNEIFKGCTFTMDTYEYILWTYGAKNVVFEDCTFITKGKALKIYHDACTTDTHNVTFTNCTFKIADEYTNTGNKPAIAVDARGSVFNITINGCNVEGYKFNDSAMSTWYNNYMTGATDTQKMFIGCEGAGIEKVHVTIDGTKFN